MKNFFSAPVLLGLCLTGVLADLPYHNFEGRDVNVDVPTLSQSTPHHPMGTETGDHHPPHHHHHHSPTGSDPPEETPYNKYEVQHAASYYHNPNPTSYPTGGYPPHHHHHRPGGPLESPPFPTNTEPYLGSVEKDERVYTMRTVTRTRGHSAGFPPHGTGSPYPHHHPREA